VAFAQIGEPCRQFFQSCVSREFERQQTIVEDRDDPIGVILVDAGIHMVPPRFDSTAMRRRLKAE